MVDTSPAKAIIYRITPAKNGYVAVRLVYSSNPLRRIRGPKKQRKISVDLTDIFEHEEAEEVRNEFQGKAAK